MILEATNTDLENGVPSRTGEYQMEGPKIFSAKL
jgi:hypothetical protein